MMQSIRALITRARRRSMLTAPLLALVTLASASCGKAVTGGVSAAAPPVVGVSSSEATSATLSHPRFVTVVGAAIVLNGVNDAGTLVGDVYIEGNDRGFIKAGNKVTEFDYPGTSDVTVVNGINDSGTTVGRYSDNLGGDRGFARSADGRFTPIDDPNAGTAFYMGTKPMGINDSGVIVGTYVDNRDVAHGFVDTAGVFTTLNEPDASMTGDVGTFVGGINNAGSITGWYVDKRGQLYGFIDTSGTYTSLPHPVPARVGAGARDRQRLPMTASPRVTRLAPSG